LTLQELSEYLRLKERLERNSSILESLYAAASPGAQVFTDMPRTPGTKDKVGDLAIEIADMEERNRHIKNEVSKLEKRINKFIDAVDDEHMRTVLRLRFIRCLTWSEVATAMGGDDTEMRIKMACYRFLS